MDQVRIERLANKGSENAAGDQARGRAGPAARPPAAAVCASRHRTFHPLRSRSPSKHRSFPRPLCGWARPVQGHSVYSEPPPFSHVAHSAREPSWGRRGFPPRTGSSPGLGIWPRGYLRAVDIRGMVLLSWRSSRRLSVSRRKLNKLKSSGRSTRRWRGRGWRDRFWCVLLHVLYQYY